MSDIGHLAEFPSRDLLEWFDRSARDLPWRQSGDPYAIWISEVMLQQTRVETVIPYYHRFLEAFPTLEALATAERMELMRIWEGLGYYSRARNLQDAARQVILDHGGAIPEEYDTLLTLKGIGPYTAAAVTSIAFGRPHAAVDGNIIRVLSRFFLIEEDIRSTSTRRTIQQIADAILDHERPGDFNQALMELGATCCSRSSPSCHECPLSSGCLAFREVRTETIPYKSSGRPVPHYTIGVGIIRDGRGRLLIALRPEEVMLGGLWEFPGGKKRENEPIEDTVRRELMEELGVRVTIGEKVMELNHAYSHFRITMHAYLCELMPGTAMPSPKQSRRIRWVEPNELQQLPFPKANRELTKVLVERFSEP